MRVLIGTLALAGMIANGMMATPYTFRELSPDEATLVTGGQLACVGVGQNASLCGWTFCLLGGYGSATWPTPYFSGNSSTRAVPCPCGGAGGQAITGQQSCGMGG